MIGSIDVYGLKIENISPINLSSIVKIDSVFSVTFNGDINTGTIPSNIFLIKDKKNMFKDMTSLNSPNNFEVVEGNVSYKNKTITFKPSSLLENNTRYVLIVKNDIKDILGRGMVLDYTGAFYTGEEALILPSVMLTPKNNSIHKTLPEFTWTTSEKALYTFQISDKLTFENIIFERDCFTNSLSLYMDLNSDTYYARVKALDTNWSETVQFYLNASNEYPVSVEDEVFDESIFDEENFEILEVFPKEYDINIDTKLKNLYVKVSGEISYKDLNYFENFLKGASYDEDDDNSHGEIDIRTIIIYDDDEDVSYIVLSMI